MSEQGVGGYKCNACGMIFNTLGELDKHTREKHKTTIVTWLHKFDYVSLNIGYSYQHDQDSCESVWQNYFLSFFSLIHYYSISSKAERIPKPERPL